MIYLNFNISKPSWWNRFENVKVWCGSTPFAFKFWEVQIIKHNNLLRLEFGLTVKQDHAGMNLELGLFGYEIHFTVYDSRHWNYIESKWEINNG